MLRTISLGAEGSAGAEGFNSAVDALCTRTTTMDAKVEATVLSIVSDVRDRGDAAVRELTERFDKRSPVDGSYEIGKTRWAEIAGRTDPKVRESLVRAYARITKFHEGQHEPSFTVDENGVRCALRVHPLKRVGIYVPGGTALYPSSVLMTAAPARVAGVDEIIMVTPGASPETLAAAEVAQVDRVFEIGGAQAVAALAYGTDTVPRVDKIVGPGNQWVASAKRIVYGDVDIDSVAGPSEVLIIADDSANPVWIAADLLAQAEHDVEARPILFTTSAALVPAVEIALQSQLETLSRADIARQSLSSYGVAVVVASVDDAIALANRYAPEHLELHLRDARARAEEVYAAGAIFVGPYAPEAAGDYVAGPNHVLPTGGAARYASPLGVHDFRKRTSVIEYSREALAAHRADIQQIAQVEGLDAHARSAAIRFENDE